MDDVPNKVSLTLELALDDELDVDLTPDAVLVAGSTAHRSLFEMGFLSFSSFPSFSSFCGVLHTLL